MSIVKGGASELVSFSSFVFLVGVSQFFAAHFLFRVDR